MQQPSVSPPASLGDLTLLGRNALDRNDIKGAEGYFREALRFAPNDVGAQHNLAVVLHHQGHLQEAEQLLTRAVSAGAQPVSLMLLGEIYEATGRDAEAFRIYKALLKAVPQHFAALMKLGNLRDKLGDKPGARDCYRRAVEVNPTDINAVQKYADAIWPIDREGSMRLLEGLLAGVGQNPDARSAVLRHYIPQKEFYERAQRGLATTHATSVDELFFKYANDHLRDLERVSRDALATNSNDNSARVGLALARFCLGDRHGADELFAASKSKGHILDAIRFSPAFFDELRSYSREKLVEGLPPLIAVTPPVPDAHGVLYLSCNNGYFQAFGAPMIVSLRERSPDTPVHLHIMDANEADGAAIVAFCRALGLKRFAVSTENPGLGNAMSKEARCYYHAVRFIRFYQHLELYRCPLWLMDVDAVVHRDLGELFATLGDADTAMRIRPGRLEPWNQFNACMVAASASERSLNYYRLIAAYTAHFYQRKSLRWGIDQLAMYAVYADLADRGEAPSLLLLGEKEIDYRYRDDGFVWCNSGAAKFKHLQRIANPNAVPLANFEDNKFLPVFEKYWNETQRLFQESAR